jgi:hypothetical protein
LIQDQTADSRLHHLSNGVIDGSGPVFIAGDHLQVEQSGNKGRK